MSRRRQTRKRSLAEASGDDLWPTEDNPGREFRKFLLEAWGSNRISAMDIAAIAQLATKAGAEGVSDLSAGCGRKDQSKKVQKGLGVTKYEDRLSYVRAPATVGGRRALVDIALHLPSTWAQTLPGFHEAPLPQHWQRKVECGELLPRTIPLAVYSDAVAGSTQNDPGFENWKKGPNRGCAEKMVLRYPQHIKRHLDCRCSKPQRVLIVGKTRTAGRSARRPAGIRDFSWTST